MKVTRKRMMIVGLIVVAALVGLQVVGAVIASAFILHPRRWSLARAAEHHGHATPADFRRPFADMQVTSGDVTIRGWLVRANPPSERAVILVHGIADNRVSMLPYLPVLEPLDVNVALIDVRAHGESGGRTLTYGVRERRDVSAVIDWLIERRLARPGAVGLIGQSLGGAIVLQAAADDDRVGAVVTDGAFASLRTAIRREAARMFPPGVLVMHSGIWLAERQAGFSVRDASPQYAADRIRCPVLLIHGDADSIIPVEQARVLDDAITADHELWIVPQGGHCDTLDVDEAAYTQRVRTFLAEHLR